MKLAEVLHPGAEAVWGATFRAAGLIARRSIRGWTPSAGRSILIIATHPDDEATGCAGTILLHSRSGDRVCIAYMTDGSRSRAGGLNAAEMRRVREQEARAAAKALQADSIEWFGLPEGSWSLEEMRLPLLSFLRRHMPETIYAPSQVDFHPEHRRVAHALAQALTSVREARITLRVYQSQVPLTPVLTNRVVDCSGVCADAAAAVELYKSQWMNVRRCLRMKRYTALFYGLEKQGEEFWQMPAEDYCRLHGTPPDCWRTAGFRGVRFRPFSDPLAYLSGLAERRRLKAAVATGSNRQRDAAVVC